MMSRMVIETERLVLRPLRLEDVDELVALQARPEVSRFMRSVDREQARLWIEDNLREWDERGHGLMAILDADSGRFLGRSGLKHWPEFDEVEVGWVLEPGVWGRGLATEAGRACAEWGLRNLDVPYLTSMIRPDNERSIRVAERLGMARLRSDMLGGQGVTVYALTREAWLALGEDA
jgi:RimJ/RimL family protein N-acetyltransferase